MSEDSIRRISTAFELAFHQLGLIVPRDEIGSLSATIYQVMSSKARSYHIPEHVIGLTDPNNPIQSLAALFHDVVNYPVDNGFSADAWQIIVPYLGECSEDESQIKFVDQVDTSDLSFLLVRELFDFSLGQTLFSTSGYNEILSALVMAKRLEHIVSTKILIQIIAFIEATIPFRPRNTNGCSSFELLAGRMKSACEAYKITMTGEEIDQTIKGAVVFANQDVGNFADADPAVFLDNTWKLLPESNPTLRQAGKYELDDYCRALHGMAELIASIKVEDVFHEYKGTPSAEDMSKNLAIIRRNLRIGEEYIEVKLVSLAILAALAKQCEEPGLVSSFLGDDLISDEKQTELVSLLQHIPTLKTGESVDKALLQLLRTTRKGWYDETDQNTRFLAEYVYQWTGTEKIHEYFESANQMFNAHLQPADFLARLDPSMLAPIAGMCAEIIPTLAKSLVNHEFE